MGVRSGRTVTRATAIERINMITALVILKDYRGVEIASSERDHDVETFVDRGTEMIDVSKWTNRMLADKLDEPFYRFSMFEAYRVVDDEKDLDD